MPAGQLYPSHWWVGIATNIVVSDESFEHVGDAPLAAAELRWRDKSTRWM
ncbi:MAG TPA: hypothetical protein VHR39_08715 [Propionibacteriaceae bacterium]|jgi:hypothetical protein|nr:hypothetical protein [Propionibacteriaceae bacterium]